MTDGQTDRQILASKGPFTLNAVRTRADTLVPATLRNCRDYPQHSAAARKTTGMLRAVAECCVKTLHKSRHGRSTVIVPTQTDTQPTTPWIKKGCHPNHGYNFVNSWSICKILSLLQTAVNFQQNPYEVTHHTLSMLLHYLGKLKNKTFALCMHVKRLKCDFL